MKSYWVAVKSNYTDNHYNQYAVAAATGLFQISSQPRGGEGFQIQCVYFQITPVFSQLYHNAASSSGKKGEETDVG